MKPTPSDPSFLAGLRRAMQSVGVEQELIDAIIPAVQAEWGGDRPYIPVNGEDVVAERSARDARIVRDYRNGERVVFLARRYHISERRVRQIVSGSALP